MNEEQFGRHPRSESMDVDHRHEVFTKERSGVEPERRAERLLHEARCAFEILGVTVRSRIPVDALNMLATEEAEQTRMMSSLVSVLGAGQSITFAYDGGGPRLLRWQIIGEAANCESVGQAAAQLRNVRHALQTVLESRKTSYRFKPVAESEVGVFGTSQRKWVYDIQPRGTHVKHARSPVGFGQPSDLPVVKETAVCLPHYIHDHARAFSSIVKLLVSSQIHLQISLTLESCRLSRAQEHALKSALAVIQDRGPASDLPAHLENAALLWLKTLSGYRITCAVRSSRPISESFMRMLGSEIYHGDVDVCCRSSAAGRTGECVSSAAPPVCMFDMRNCFPSSLPLPALFPQPEVLARYGMRRFFNREQLVLPGAGLLMGCIRDGHAEQPVRLCHRERSRHLYILGATGTGKSTLLYNLAMSDIDRGEGVCLVDPHGDLYQKVLESIPSHRAGDVVLLDPGNRERAVGINLLDCTGPHREMQVNFVINEALAILEKLYDMKTCGGPVFEQYFRGALQLIMADPGNAGTLVEMSAVFEHKAFRDALVKKCAPSLLADFWKMAENTGGEARLPNVAPYIVSKLNMFVHSAMLRPIIGQAKSTVDFRQIMDNRGILLVNLSRGALGELDMRLLGMVVLTKLICAAMSRLDVAAHRRKPFMLYVDEFQNFTSDATASLLSESRKFGLCLTLANQNLAQLTVGKGQENLVHSVLGNVGSMALFRLGAPDADKLGIYTRPNFGPEDLQTLPNFHAASRLLTPTGPTEPFVFETYPACRRRANPAVMRRIKKSSHRYSASIAAIEREIHKRREAIRAIGESSGDKKPASGPTGKA